MKSFKRVVRDRRRRQFCPLLQKLQHHTESGGSDCLVLASYFCLQLALHPLAFVYTKAYSALTLCGQLTCVILNFFSQWLAGFRTKATEPGL